MAKSDTNGDSETGFKSALLRYLRYYQISPLREYIDAVAKCDFSEVNAFFLASVPDSHKGSQMNLWGHKQVSAILKKHLDKKINDWPTILQCSSIGSLGAHPDVWFRYFN